MPAVHSRDAKIYIDDPGPWIMGLATEARYSVRPSPEVCVCDLCVHLGSILKLFTHLFWHQGYQLSVSFLLFRIFIRVPITGGRNCASPPSGVVSQKQQRDKYRQRLLTAFDIHYHPDHSVPRSVVAASLDKSLTSCRVANSRKPSQQEDSDRFARFRPSVEAHHLPSQNR